MAGCLHAAAETGGGCMVVYVHQQLVVGGSGVYVWGLLSAGVADSASATT